MEQSNVKAAIAYDDLREWLSLAERLGEVRNVSGASWQEDIGLAAEAVLRAENGPCVVFDDIPGCPKGFRVLLNMFAGTRRNMTLGFPDHLSQMGTERRLSRGLSEGSENHSARDRRGRPGAGERADGRRYRCHQISRADLAREGRRPLYRHRHLQHHPRSGGELAQCRRLSRAGARPQFGRHPDRGRPSRRHPSREIFQARRADAGRDGARRRSAELLLRRPRSALRHFRDRHRRRLARPADARWCAARSPACRFRPMPRSCSKVSSRRSGARSKARSANGPAIMPAAPSPPPCSTSRRSITATIRSCSACRRWAPVPTKWRVTARCCARRRSSRT